MIFVVFKIVGRLVLWGALPLTVIVNDQVEREAHEPILQIALFGVVCSSER